MHRNAYYVWIKGGISPCACCCWGRTSWWVRPGTWSYRYSSLPPSRPPPGSSSAGRSGHGSTGACLIFLTLPRNLIFSLSLLSCRRTDRTANADALIGYSCGSWCGPLRVLWSYGLWYDRVFWHREFPCSHKYQWGCVRLLPIRLHWVLRVFLPTFLSLSLPRVQPSLQRYWLFRFHPNRGHGNFGAELIRYPETRHSPTLAHCRTLTLPHLCING